MSHYFQMSTATPTGFRPWNFAIQDGTNLGHMHRRRPLGRLRGLGRMGRVGALNFSRLGRLRGMGVTIPGAQALQSTADSYAAQLAQMQQALTASLQQAAAAQQAGVDMSSELATINSQQADLNGTIDSFNTAYRATYGTVAPGLGVPWLAVSILTAAALAVLAEWIAAWWSTQNQVNTAIQTKANTAAAAQSSANAITAQAAAACSAGLPSCDSLTALAQQSNANIQASLNPGLPGLPTDWTTWIQNNAVTIGLVFAGIIIVPKILKKI
jgi:hypothetical protein